MGTHSIAFSIRKILPQVRWQIRSGLCELQPRGRVAMTKNRLLARSRLEALEIAKRVKE